MFLTMASHAHLDYYRKHISLSSLLAQLSVEPVDIVQISVKVLGG